jgi:hypothetical protein
MNNCVKINNTGFNLDAFEKMSKTEFKKWYKERKRDFNIDEAWKIIQTAIKERKKK